MAKHLPSIYAVDETRPLPPSSDRTCVSHGQRETVDVRPPVESSADRNAETVLICAEEKSLRDHAEKLSAPPGEP